MFVLKHIFREKYINYIHENIIERKKNRNKEIINLRDESLDSMRKIENVVKRIRNNKLKKKITELNRICYEYAEYVLNSIYEDENEIFIRNYYNMILIKNTIVNITNLINDLNTNGGSFKTIKEIKKNIENIEIIVISEQVKSNQYL